MGEAGEHNDFTILEAANADKGVCDYRYWSIQIHRVPENRDID